LKHRVFGGVNLGINFIGFTLGGNMDDLLA
jgi:hypothetical protein